MTEKQASSEIAQSPISDEDRKRLLVLLGSEMDKAEMTWYPGKVIDPVLRAMLGAERDTRERVAQFIENAMIPESFRKTKIYTESEQEVDKYFKMLADSIRGKE